MLFKQSLMVHRVLMLPQITILAVTHVHAESPARVTTPAHLGTKFHDLRM